MSDARTGRATVRAYAATLFLMVILAAAAEPAARLAPAPAGGWFTEGLPYRAEVSPRGLLRSLRVGAFEFLAPAAGTDEGFFLASGDTVLQPGAARVSGDRLDLESAEALVSLRFLPARIEVTVRNLGIADGHCARLAIRTALARLKNADTSEEQALPLTTVPSGRLRLIAPNGASLTVPGQSLVPGADAYQLRLPWAMPRGPEQAFALEVATAPLLEDAIQVSARAPTTDFVYPTGAPQPFLTDITNRTDAAVRGTVQLLLRSYLPAGPTRQLEQRLRLSKGETRVLTWALEELEPGLYIAEVWFARGDERRLCAAPRLVFNAPAILPPAPPEDFAAFWERTLEEQAKLPPDFQIAKTRDQGNSEVYKFSFAGLLGHRAYGYLTVPRDRSRKYPAVLFLPSAGVHNLQPPAFANDDHVGMAINIAWVDVDLPPEQYDWRTWPAPYLVTGILDRDSYSLRFSYAACVRAAEILAARPEVDPADIIVTGSSQGGGLTLVTAGLYPGFKAAVANVPGLCRLDWNLDLQPPYFPIACSTDTRPLIARTLRYYDAVHFARRIQCPVWVSLGLGDDVTPSLGVFCAFNAIPAERKTLRVDAAGGHGGGWAWDWRVAD